MNASKIVVPDHADRIERLDRALAEVKRHGSVSVTAWQLLHPRDRVMCAAYAPREVRSVRHAMGT
jgi:hypothetical protein